MRKTSLVLHFLWPACFNGCNSVMFMLTAPIEILVDLVRS